MSNSIAKVVVIGAGVAGLKAAHALINDPKSQFSAQDILVLEAQDYIGGRVKTDKTSSKLGYSYDLGAAWFHDCLTNVVLKEAIEDNDPDSFDFAKDGYFDDQECNVYDPDNGLIDVKGLHLTAVVEEICKFVEVYFYEDLEKPDVTMLDIVDIYYQKYGKRLTNKQMFYAKKMIRRFELWHGASSDDVSAKFGVLEHQGRNLYNKKGNHFLIEKLLKNIPRAQILLNHAVTKIIRNNRVNDKDIAIETTKGTFFCDFVVVTLPLSMLALPTADPQYIEWVPALPNSITEAVGNMTFSALGKVIFEFDKVWWPPHEDRFAILSSEDNSKELSEPLQRIPAEFKYPTEIINYQSVHRDDPSPKGGSLVLLIQRPLTDYLERNPQDAWPYFKKALTHLVVPGKEVSDPINVIATQWTQNPYIRGSYAGVGVGNDPEYLIAVLSGEIEGVGLSGTPVRFAGEHTIGEGSGCIHGAYMSGDREAQWIINNYNSSKHVSSDYLRSKPSWRM